MARSFVGLVLFTALGLSIPVAFGAASKGSCTGGQCEDPAQNADASVLMQQRVQAVVSRGAALAQELLNEVEEMEKSDPTGTNRQSAPMPAVEPAALDDELTLLQQKLSLDKRQGFREPPSNDKQKRAEMVAADAEANNEKMPVTGDTALQDTSGVARNPADFSADEVGVARNPADFSADEVEEMDMKTIGWPTMPYMKMPKVILPKEVRDAFSPSPSPCGTVKCTLSSDACNTFKDKPWSKVPFGTEFEHKPLITESNTCLHYVKQSECCEEKFHMKVQEEVGMWRVTGISIFYRLPDAAGRSDEEICRSCIAKEEESLSPVVAPVHSKDSTEVGVDVCPAMVGRCEGVDAALPEGSFALPGSCKCRGKNTKMSTWEFKRLVREPSLYSEPVTCWRCSLLPDNVETCRDTWEKSTSHFKMLLPTNCEKDSAVYEVKHGDQYCGGGADFVSDKKKIESAAAIRSTQGCANAVLADSECSGTFYYGSAKVKFNAVGHTRDERVCRCMRTHHLCTPEPQNEGDRVSIYSVTASDSGPNVVDGCGFSSGLSKFAGIGFGGGENTAAEVANQHHMGAGGLTGLLSPLPGFTEGSIHDESLSCREPKVWDVPEVCIRAILNELAPEYENHRQWAWSRSMAWGIDGMVRGPATDNERTSDCNEGSLKARGEILFGRAWNGEKNHRTCWDFINDVKSLYCDAKLATTSAPYHQVCSHTATEWNDLSPDVQKAELNDLHRQTGDDFFTPKALEWLNA